MKQKYFNKKLPANKDDLMVEAISSSMFVSDEDDEEPKVTSRLEKKLDSIVALLSSIAISQKQHDDRLRQVEESLDTKCKMSDVYSSSDDVMSSLASAVQDDDYRDGVVRDQTGKRFPSFLYGEENSKGGFYTVNHGEKVYILPKKGETSGYFGYVMDETKHFIRIKQLDNDSDSKGSLVGKQRVRRAIPKTE